MQHSVTIRMGASHWDARIVPSGGAEPLHFNFREMSRDERRAFHATFMAAYRKSHPMYAAAEPVVRPKRRRKRRPHNQHKSHRRAKGQTGARWVSRERAN